MSSHIFREWKDNTCGWRLRANKQLDNSIEISVVSIPLMRHWPLAQLPPTYTSTIPRDLLRMQHNLRRLSIGLLFISMEQPATTSTLWWPTITPPAFRIFPGWYLLSRPQTLPHTLIYTRSRDRPVPEDFIYVQQSRTLLFAHVCTIRVSTTIELNGYWIEAGQHWVQIDSPTDDRISQNTRYGTRYHYVNLWTTCYEDQKNNILFYACFCSYIASKLPTPSCASPAILFSPNLARYTFLQYPSYL